MKIQVHRGTCEIGGTCIELTSGDARIVLDIGMPLMNEDGTEFDSSIHKDKEGPQLLAEGILPPVEGLYRWQEPAVSALFITHGHQDHYGFLQFVHPEIPVHMSDGTSRLIHLYPEFTGQTPSFGRIVPFNRRAHIVVGPFAVRPYLVDHSTFSAFAYEVAAEGKRIFYTGDFRGHGYMNKTLNFIYQNVAPGIDALLMEGTTLSDSSEPVHTEEELSTEAVKACQDSNQAVMIWQSSQNVARIFTFYHAAKQSGRRFVLDVFTAFVLHELSRTEGGQNLPYPGKPGFDDVHVWYPWKLANRLANNGGEALLHRFAPFAIRKEDVAKDPGRYMMFMRKGMELDLDRYKGLHGGTMFYSMWSGYLEKTPERRFLEKAREFGITVKTLHTSGHADLSALQEMVTRTAPKLLIPIHTTKPAAFREHFDCPVASPEEARGGITL